MPEPVITVTELTKRYGDFTAVRAASFDACPGEVFVLLGPNGAGKTTTIRMLMGVLKPSAGAARIQGLDCFAQRAEVMRHVGYLPDDPVFYDFLRGREILQFVGEMHGLPRRQVQFRAGPLVERLKLTEAMEEFAVNYSRGMKKKLALACALLHEPSVLILDEPTSGLDPFATRTLHEMMRGLAGEGRAVFLSTHLLEQAERLCDKVAILHEGRLVALGRLDELRQSAPGNRTLEEIFFAVAGGEEAAAPEPLPAAPARPVESPPATGGGGPT